MPRTFGFRRGMALALEACLARSGAGEIWLDAGCGRGQLARTLSRRGRRVIRLDVDPAMLLYSTSSEVEQRSTAGLSIPGVCADAARIPHKSERFGGVLAISLLGCLEDPSNFFDEVARVLVPGGFLVFTYTNRASLLLRASRLIGGETPGQPISGAIRLHGSRTIDDGLRKVGFEILERRIYHFVCDAGPWSFPSPAVATRMERFGRAGRLAWLGRNGLVVARSRPLSDGRRG